MAPGGDEVSSNATENVSITAIVYVSVLFTLLVMSFVLMCMKMSFLGQKTRNPQQRRVYVGSRARPSLGQHEPTIYVSPSNLPPPPKYECMAPPSYEEVVGIHYPNYQVQQPISQPIANALAQTQPSTAAQPSATAQPSSTAQSNETVVRNVDETVVTVTERPAVTSS